MKGRITHAIALLFGFIIGALYSSIIYFSM